MASFRRKTYFIQHGLQLRFARFVVVFVLLASLLTGVVIFLTTFMLMGEKLASVYPQGRLTPIFQSVFFWAFFSVLAVVPFIFWGAVLFSHRIAGPLPKIYRALRNIGNGQYDVKLVLRRHDELKELADEINQMARHLKEVKGLEQKK